ncbi:hypothetical protein GCM10023339_41080 [Alloalcanivorax gelatiniphagus]
MSVVEDLLGLQDGGEPLEIARCRWDKWSGVDGRLRMVDGYDQLRPWLREADYEAIDDMLLALAELAALDGGNDVVAAGVLAKCLMPGACSLAAWLHRRQQSHPFRDNQPGTSGGPASVVDELVASQLWIEVRTVGWQRIRRVAANILLDTRAAVLLELGDHFQVERRDRSWARTLVTDDPVRSAQPVTDDYDSDAAAELADLLAWANESDVISPSDGQLLASVLEEAAAVETRNLRRGRGGLMSNEVSRRVAARMGVSDRTVRRHTSRAVGALADAAPRFTHAC